MTAREWKWYWGPTWAPMVRLERLTWDTPGDCRRDWWAISLIQGQWPSQGFERFDNGAWNFSVGPLCMWHEPDVDTSDLHWHGM